MSKKWGPLQAGRWGFGMDLTGTHFASAPDQAVQVGGTTQYVVSPTLKSSSSYGLSHIGCMIKDGVVQPTPAGAAPGEPTENDEWPDVNSRRTRTLIAWSAAKKSFFMISCESFGWSWTETVNFLQTAFTNEMRDIDGMQNFKVGTAMMLDGGSNVQFIWRKVPAKGKEESATNIEYALSKGENGKPVPTLVRSYVP